MFPFLSRLSQKISNIILGSSICASKSFNKASGTSVISMPKYYALSLLSSFCLKLLIFSCFYFTSSIYTSTVEHILYRSSSFLTEIWPVKNRLCPFFLDTDAVFYFHSSNFFLLYRLMYLPHIPYTVSLSLDIFFSFFLSCIFQVLRSIVLKHYF